MENLKLATWQQKGQDGDRQRLQARLRPFPRAATTGENSRAGPCRAASSRCSPSRGALMSRGSTDAARRAVHGPLPGARSGDLLRPSRRSTGRARRSCSSNRMPIYRSGPHPSATSWKRGHHPFGPGGRPARRPPHICGLSGIGRFAEMILGWPLCVPAPPFPSATKALGLGAPASGLPCPGLASHPSGMSFKPICRIKSRLPGVIFP